MAQTYTPVGWKNKPSTDTPINADNLKHMDDAILDLYEGGATTNDIVISDTEPTDPDVKLWIDTGEIASASSEITDSYSTSAGLGYSCNYMNGVIGKILWTNESPSSNIENGTQITLSSDDYDMLEIYYKYTTGNSNMWSKKILKGFSCYLDIALPYYTSANYTANEYRTFTRNSDTQYTLSDAKITYSGSTNITRTDYIIPLYIIGYKTGLFS